MLKYLCDGNANGWLFVAQTDVDGRVANWLVVKHKIGTLSTEQTSVHTAANGCSEPFLTELTMSQTELMFDGIIIESNRILTLAPQQYFR